jgi:hypothetical protein
MMTPRSAASLAPTVVAFYGRYSDLELQRSSIDDQFRTCCEHATKNGWIVNQDYVCAAPFGSERAEGSRSCWNGPG